MYNKQHEWANCITALKGKKGGWADIIIPAKTRPMSHLITSSIADSSLPAIYPMEGRSQCSPQQVTLNPPFHTLTVTLHVHEATQSGSCFSTIYKSDNGNVSEQGKREHQTNSDVFILGIGIMGVGVQLE